MNGVTDVRYRVVSMLPGMRIIRLFYRMESPFITPAMARDWVAMIFLSLATTRIPTLILFRKMWVCIDEYNNLGWFASDRFQPEGKVCIYVFIPNTSKQTYNYEAMEQQEIIRLAQIHSLKETWKDKQAVTEALQRLKAAISHKPKERRAMDFEFVIDDHTTYYLMSDFKSAKAKTLFQRYQQMEKDYYQQEEKLNGLRQQYAGANQQGKAKMAPAILDLEKRILQMSEELDALEVNVRNAEKTK